MLINILIIKPFKMIPLGYIYLHVNICMLHIFIFKLGFCFNWESKSYGGRVVTLSPPTSEAGVRFLARPQVGKLLVASLWLAVYSTEP